MPNQQPQQSAELLKSDAKSVDSQKRRRDRRIGVVDSISGAKTVRVVVERLVPHKLYGKYIRRKTKLLVHDPEQRAKLGDTVEIELCRPISKRKSWRLVKIVKTSQADQSQQENIEQDKAENEENIAGGDAK
ncbi:MAG: 30S ribosomal protein S17 [Thermoproteota archaeon]|nr:MAG: 30S ribosomal protein S17 [Candidatus Korarchaeota archaeon]